MIEQFKLRTVFILTLLQRLTPYLALLKFSMHKLVKNVFVPHQLARLEPIFIFIDNVDNAEGHIK